VSTPVTSTELLCDAAVVPSAPRVTVNVFPETEFTVIISSSITILNVPDVGNDVALATETLVTDELMEPDSVDEGLFANRSIMHLVST
jgi:hypothetical protein